MTDALADLGAAGISAVNVYPRWTYQPIDPSDGQLSLDGDGDTHTGYRRIDTISTDVLGAYRGALGDDITADEIFCRASPTTRTATNSAPAARWNGSSSATKPKPTPRDRASSTIPTPGATSTTTRATSSTSSSGSSPSASPP
jgi:hypothetical protein